MRDPQWQHDFLSKSVPERIEQANALRAKSQQAVELKQADIMDVNADAVSSCFETHSVNCIIHGHTHRPADHRLSDGLTRRVVLGDWHETHAMVGCFDGTELRLERFE